jgi:hypothetical protein
MWAGMYRPTVSKSATSLQFINWSIGGTARSMTVQLQSDSNGQPSGTVLATGTVTPTANFTWNSATITSFSMNAGTAYWIVVSASTMSGTNTLDMRRIDDPDGLVSGIANRFSVAISTNSGSTWANQGSQWMGCVGVGYSDSTFEGCGYSDFDTYNINNTNNRWGEYFQVPSNITINSIGGKFFASAAGTPTADLTFVLMNADTTTTLVTGTLVTAANITTTATWYDVAIANTSLVAGTNYRLYFTSAATASPMYTFRPPKTVNNGNGNAMTFGGTTSVLANNNSGTYQTDSTRDMPFRMLPQLAVVRRATGLNSSGAASVTAAFASNTAGNTLIALALVANVSLTGFAISDTAGNTWTPIASYANIGGKSISAIAWVAYNCLASAGTNTVTVTDGSHNTSLGIYEVQGLASSASFDKSAALNQTSSATPNSGATATTSYANEFVLSGSIDNGTILGAYTLGTGFQALQLPTATAGIVTAFEEKIVSATGAQTGSFNLSASNGFEGTIVLTFADTPLSTLAGMVVSAFAPGQTWINRFAKAERHPFMMPGKPAGVANVFGMVASVGFTGGQAKTTNRSMTGALSFVGAVGKAITRSVSASLNFSAAMIRSTIKVISGGLNFSAGFLASHLRLMALTASLSFVGSQGKTAGKSFTGSLNFSGSYARSALKRMIGTLSFTGSQVKQTFHGLAATLSFIGGFLGSHLRLMSMTATLSFIGSQVKQTSRGLTGGLSFTGAVNKLIAHSFTAGLSFAGSIVKRANKGLVAALSFVGNIAKAISHGLTAAISWVGNLVTLYIPHSGNNYTKALAASLSFTGSQSKLTNRGLVAALGFIGGMAKLVTRSFGGAVAFVGRFTKTSVKSFAGVLTFAGTFGIGKLYARAFTATLSFVGTQGKLINRGFTAVLGLLGLFGVLPKITPKAPPITVNLSSPNLTITLNAPIISVTTHSGKQ